MIRKTQIVVIWEDHESEDSPDWVYTLRVGGVDAERVTENWEHTPDPKATT